MPKRDPDHHHHYVVHNQRDEPDRRRPPRGMITYTFYKCDAPGSCDQRDKMTIKRWKANKDV
jgi:hypothetical protein